MNAKTQFLLIWIIALSASIALADRPANPNVVLILTDDLGWQDVKCYDIDEPSPMETPNIDALAQKGVMFWQAYAPAPTCAPSRCAIMSGNHPARAQKTHVVGGAPPVPHHRRSWRMITPWYSGRMPADEVTLAKVLKQNGYVTGHCGKWHMAINHHAFPQPEDQGFDWTRHDRGATKRMHPHRLTGFATDKPDDPFRLDENGFPYHQNSEDALTFLRENHDKPFFLYYATWLVHAPIHTRSKQLLDKYVQKLGVELPENPQEWTGEGQTNPFYCAMVEQLDYYVGKLVHYLETTEDPRWPGHMVSENTYLIFTSDNGGMEGHPGEIYTDNYPLDKGKISAMEGGTRVPLVITGPGIKAGVQSEVMVNGLDFYPTILSLVGAEKPAGKHFDGADLAPLLLQDPTDAALVRSADGKVRDTMVWHFPHSVALESTIRIGDYKLVRNYDHVNNSKTRELELYRLYDCEGGRQQRVDIEEAKNLADALPDKAQEMNERLTEILTEMKASYPYYNPYFRGGLPNKEKVCEVVSHRRVGDEAEFTYQANGAQVVRADLIYTLNGGQQYEEWFRASAELLPDMKVSAPLPNGTTHYFINLIDENNFLVSYPQAVKSKNSYTQAALKSKPPATLVAAPADGPVDLLAAGGFQLNKNWRLKNGVLRPSKTPGGIIWSKDTYDDFKITLEYKTSEKCNSGLFFRSNPKNPVQGGFEIQIASDGHYTGKHVVGSLYDAQAQAKAAGKPDGQWNTMTLTCQGPKIAVVLNGQEILNANIDDWTTPHKNPDGSKNKFKTALKDLPRTGHIGLQYHGHPIWYRNIRVVPLK